jgi:hypothetical protein
MIGREAGPLDGWDSERETTWGFLFPRLRITGSALAIFADWSITG